MEGCDGGMEQEKSGSAGENGGATSELLPGGGGDLQERRGWLYLPRKELGTTHHCTLSRSSTHLIFAS